MIIKETFDNLFIVDTGRPSFFNQEQADFWRDFHTWIKETDMEIVVSGAFHMVDEMLEEEDAGYGGGGFRYYFGLKNQLDVDKFKEKWNFAFEPHKMRYMPERKEAIRMFQDKNEKIFAFYEEEGSKTYVKLKELADKNIANGNWIIVEWQKDQTIDGKYVPIKENDH